MWVLEAQPSGSTDERSLAAQQVKHYLPAGLHVVGRTQAIGQSCIVVDEDKSISRQHATVTVDYTSPLIRVKDMGRYGTLVNKQELKGGEANLTEGDLLQFGHKSSFRLRRWHCGIAAMQRYILPQQSLLQLGFEETDAQSATCIMTAEQACLTADMACTFAHQKPYVTETWLQAIVQRSLLSDPPARMVDHIPTVTSSLSNQQMPLQPVFNQHLLASWSVIIPTTISQGTPAFAAAVQKHDGALGLAPTSANMATVLVTSDLQQPDLGDASPNVPNLHVTTVDHVLVAMLHGTTDNMTQEVSQDKLSAAWQKAAPGQTAHLKRKASAAANAEFMPPSSKRRHTGHILGDNAATNALGSSATASAGHAPAVSAPMQLQEARIAIAADDLAQLSTEAADIATNNIQGLPPDNNAIVWEPLVVRVQPQVPSVAWSDRYADVPNFKNFRKVHPQREDVAHVPYADRNYAENSIDSTAFLNHQKSKHQQRQVAEELFNANVRVQKQSALPAGSAAVTKAGRGRGRGKSLA